jgi:hypothetical protein
MTHPSSPTPARGVVVGLLVALLVLTVEDGIWSVYRAAVSPHFAPEIGPLGGFIVASVALAAYFAPCFLLVACPFLWLARRVLTRRRWPLSAVAALLVAGMVSVLSAGLDDPRREMLLIVGFSLLPAGIGAYVVLRRWNLSSPRGDQIV